jgi:hypothetical protein
VEVQLQYHNGERYGSRYATETHTILYAEYVVYACVSEIKGALLGLGSLILNLQLL